MMTMIVIVMIDDKPGKLLTPVRTFEMMTMIVMIQMMAMIVIVMMKSQVNFKFKAELKWAE